MSDPHTPEEAREIANRALNRWPYNATPEEAREIANRALNRWPYNAPWESRVHHLPTLATIVLLFADEIERLTTIAEEGGLI